MKSKLKSLSLVLVYLLCGFVAFPDAIAVKTELHDYVIRRRRALDVERLIADKKVDYLNEKDSLGKTALHYAASRGALETIKVLVSKGASVLEGDYNKMTPLHYAAKYGRSDTVKYLLEHSQARLSVDLGDKFGKTPLHYAVGVRLPYTANYLIDIGHANIYVCDGDGKIPLDYARGFSINSIRIRMGLPLSPGSGDEVFNTHVSVPTVPIVPQVVVAHAPESAESVLSGVSVVRRTSSGKFVIVEGGTHKQPIAGVDAKLASKDTPKPESMSLSAKQIADVQTFGEGTHTISVDMPTSGLQSADQMVSAQALGTDACTRLEDMPTSEIPSLSVDPTGAVPNGVQATSENTLNSVEMPSVSAEIAPILDTFDADFPVLTDDNPLTSLVDRLDRVGGESSFSPFPLGEEDELLRWPPNFVDDDL